MLSAELINTQLKNLFWAIYIHREYLIVKQDTLRETWSHVTPALVTDRLTMEDRQGLLCFVLLSRKQKPMHYSCCLPGNFSLLPVKIVLTIEYKTLNKKDIHFLSS